MVTVTDDEARRIEQRPDNQTQVEIMGVLRKMFGCHIPEMEAILIPRWGKDRIFKGTYSNWPIGVSTHDLGNLRVVNKSQRLGKNWFITISFRY